MGVAVTRQKHPDVIVYVKAGHSGQLPEATYTEANDIYVVLYNQNGVHSHEVKLAYPYVFQQHNDHHSFTITHKFLIAGLRNFGPIEKIELWRKPRKRKGKKDAPEGWYVERIAVESIYEKDCISIFPVHRWVYTDIKYNFHRYGVSLPQNDSDMYIRDKELDLKRSMYSLDVKTKGLPPQVKSLPVDEEFSFPEKWDIGKRKQRLIEENQLEDIGCGEWESFEEMMSVYRGDFEKPRCLDHDWQSDKHFGEQRLGGCCPMLISLCTKIPEKLYVTDRMVEPFLEGYSLAAAIELRRMFVINLEILTDIPCQRGQVAAPIALFYLNNAKELKPVAIQLYQTRNKDNPVFLPSDPQYTWLMAKMWYNHAESTYQQTWAHIGLSHFIMESIAVCTHRNLSSSHPIFKILAPHFVHLMAVNNRALSYILNPGGWMDTNTNIGIVGLNEITRRSFEKWRLNIQGTLQRDLQNRGVLDVNLLPYYPYRDDAFALDGAIRRYVRTVLSGHYKNSMEDIEQDSEVQKWREELVESLEEGGCGLQGVPGIDMFGTLDELINTVSGILFTCSVHHAAVTCPQYDEYGYPPNYPTLLKEAPPKKRKRSESAILLSACRPKILQLTSWQSPKYSVVTMATICQNMKYSSCMIQ
uniref:Allene oxide synthase-lipoxygenase protein-like isoform X2 n=1 Tax=Saccoglossus kowalevskii TaxID=10224 RepID=A0ABM0LW01_SACKO|nr:PREDICTED: allene oxide synthase-lipoxygenase protein-like isoform X2 [Saccoglossus kowalevskii]